MVKKVLLLLVIPLLGPFNGIDCNPKSYTSNSEETQNGNHGPKQTIHTLKGHFNEESRRFHKCDAAPEHTKEIDSKSSILKHNGSNVSNLQVKSNIRNEQEITDIENIVAEMLKDIDNPNLHHLKDQEKLNQNNGNVHKIAHIDPKDLVLDKVQKNFEFESLFIKNEGDDVQKHGVEIDMENYVPNDNRRLYFYDEKEAEIPINNFNPLHNPPPRAYTPEDLLNSNPSTKLQDNDNDDETNMKKNINDNTNNKSDKNPDLNIVNETTQSSIETTRGNISAKHTHIPNEDTDMFRSLIKNISSIDVRTHSDPSEGIAVTEMDKSNLMIMHHPRACYICNSLRDPSCWKPDKKTTTKYCRSDHNACLAKIYRYKGYSFITRDCGSTCSKRNLANLGLNYAYCTICHSDLCNNANSVRMYAINILVSLFILMYFKITN